MPTAKIEVKIGSFAFSGEGEENWLAKQLEKVLERTEKISSVVAPEGDDSVADKNTKSKSLGNTTLASYLSSKNATTNQTKKFLATATWLQLRGATRLSTGDVAKALKDSNQNKLGNPADCLLKNIKKGLCEKDGNQFFVTHDGIKSLS